MKLISLCILFSISTFSLKAQTELVINNDGFVVIDNGAYLVLGASVSAVTTLGTGGNIISEAETDVIKWHVTANTVAITIPWTTSVATSNVKVPLTMNFTIAGVGPSGYLLLSTYETTTDNNTPWQSSVTNFCSSSSTDGSLNVADRFWLIEASNYTTKPAVDMTMGYNPAANEIGGSNSIVEANLLAQTFNPTLTSNCLGTTGGWDAPIGVNNAASDNVSSIIVSPSNFHRTWVLIDDTNPLSIELVNFGAHVFGRYVQVDWSTVSEDNNDYFIVQRSSNQVDWENIDQVDGAGNSIVLIDYQTFDYSPKEGLSYYRLKQVDFNGEYKYSDVDVVSFSNDSDDLLMYPNPAHDYVTIVGNLEELESLHIYNYLGQDVTRKIEVEIVSAEKIKLNVSSLATGVYSIVTKTEVNRLVIN